MYKAIYDYAVEHNLALPKYRKERQIKGYIKLSSTGEYEGFEKVPKDEVTRVWCPHVVDGAPTIICEKFQYIFPNDTEDASVKSKRRYNGWLEIMKEGAQHAETLRVIYCFLEHIDENLELCQNLKNEITNSGLKGGDFISFRVDSVNAEKRNDWVEWFNSYAEERMPCNHRKNLAISELTGQPIVPITGKFPKNNSKGTGTGVPLFSNQHKKAEGEACSFVSYGCINAIACPMAQEEADAIDAGLKTLLDSETNNDKDFNFVYWYDRQDAIDLITRASSRRHSFNEKNADCAEREREAQYSAVLNAVFDGTSVQNISDIGKYHIIEYNLPDRGRISLSKEYIGTYKELYASLQKWYADTAYTDVVWIKGENGKPKPKGIAMYTIDDVWSVLYQCLRNGNAKDKNKEIKSEFGPVRRNLIKSMLLGKRVPKVFLQNASEQLTRYYIARNKFKEEKRSRRILLQVIKASLLREGYKDMDTVINKDAESVGYQCGRWFAAMVRIQELSTKETLNVTMAKRYYRAVKKAPAQTFTMINDLKEHYLGKLETKSRIMMERLFAEISEHIGVEFPERFSVIEQGAFDLGYAQQRQAFFERANSEQL